ncbi:hypothetical protein Ancab_007221 [Ancistrocladus abbreviatus]
MDGHMNSISCRSLYYHSSSSSSDLLAHLQPPQTITEEVIDVNELNSVASMMTSNITNTNNNYYYYSNSSGSSGSGSGYSNSSGSFVGSPSSPTSYFSTQRSSLIQRSLSSHSLSKNASGLINIQPVSPPNTAAWLLQLQDSDINGPVRRVFSTGDLQQGINTLPHCRRAESPLSNENSGIIEGMTKACRYSPEEKRERIERYRSKRSQRNFNKKIQYACRKTLADTRPRIKGRFARNDEQLINNTSIQNQWTDHHTGMEDDDEDEETWMSLLDSLSSANNF